MDGKAPDDTNQEQRVTHSFIVRLWRYRSGEPAPSDDDWYGEIEPVPNGSGRRAFKGLEQLAGRLREFL